MIDPNQFRASILLCDAAQVQSGKLFVLGGGWSRILKLQPALTMALAVRIEVPWHESNRRHQLRIRLLDQDGAPVRPPDLPLDAGAEGFEIHGEFEAGRPPGLAQGSFLDNCIALNFQLNLEPGGYVWALLINGNVLTSYPFEVVVAPAGMVQQG